MVEGLSEQSLDNSLAADIELFGEAIQFLEHGSRKIYVDALDRLDALA